LRPKDRNHGNQRFSNEDELAFTGVCLAFTSKGTPLSPKEAIEIMRFWNKCGEEWDRWKLFAGFIGRHTLICSPTQLQRESTQHLLAKV
jgi:hypothetical protein